MASFKASPGPPFVFESVPEVDCECVANGGEPLPEQVEEFINRRRERDELNERWRQTLMKIWKLARQTKSGELTDHARELSNDAINLLSEMKTKHQQCKRIFSSLIQQNKVQLCPLATCFWSPKKTVQLSCSVFSHKDDIAYSRTEGKTFHAATVSYLERNFKNLNQAHRVPSVLIMKQGTKRRHDGGHKDGGQIGQLSYYSDRHLRYLETLTQSAVQEITDERRGVRAVELLVEKLISCERELSGGMFVVSNLKHQNYLCKINYEGQLVTAQDGDHDIIVIHRRLGVIFFQVKGCSSEADKKTKRQAVNKALEQVMMDKFVFMESNRDIDFVHNSLPVYGFAALPHVQSVELDELNICSTHRQNILTLSDLGNLSGWLKERISPCNSGKTEVMDEDQYKAICGRYVGLVSMVSLRTYDEGIRKVGQMVQFAFLTPAQLALVEETHYKYLCLTGDYGTGKSLVLARKAQRLVEEDDGCVAFIISCSDIDNYQFCKFGKPYRSADQLRRFVNDESLSSEKIRILQFSEILQGMQDPDEKGKRMVSSEEFYDTIISYISDFVTKNPNVKTHLFLDEVLTSLLLVGLFSGVERCQVWDNIESALPEGSFCWMSISTHSYKMSKYHQPNRLLPYFPVAFKWYYLEFIMRVPSHVCSLVKGIEEYIGKGFFHHSSIGHTFEGPMPLLSTLTDCKCLSPIAPLCLCGQSRLLEVLKKVMERFNFKVHDVTIIIFFFHCEEHLLPLYRCFQAVVQNAFFELGVKLEWNTMYGLQIPWVGRDPNSVQKVIPIVDQHTFIGCECQNMMCIDMFSMFQWFETSTEWFTFIANRCSSQYIHINWPQAEAREQWLCFLDGYEKYCTVSEVGVSMNSVTELLTTARGSQGGCVEALKGAKLFQEI